MQKMRKIPERTKDVLLIFMSMMTVVLLFLIGCESKKKAGEETLNGPNSTLFRKPLPDDVTRPFIRDFRDLYKHDITHGIVYDSAVLRHYLDNIYPYLKDRMGEKDGYEWKVGFYWMRKIDTAANGTIKGPRLNFLVVPTRVKKDDGTVLDFFDHPDDYKQMNPPKTRLNDPPCQTCAGYDAGQLWP